MGIVYILTNNVNGKQYIGTTGRELKQRLAEHKHSSTNARTKIAKAIKRHGWDNFSCEVLHEHPDFSVLLKLEGKEIKYRETYGKKGYNTNSAKGTNERYIFRPSTVVQSLVRMYADNAGCSTTQALEDLLQLGGTIWLQNIYKGED